MKKAYQAVATGKKVCSTDYEKTEMLMLEAKIKAAEGDWVNAQKLQKKALQKIDNSFSEIRIAYQNYAYYSLRAGNKIEAESAIAVLNKIAPRHPDILKLEKRLSEK